MRAHDGQIRGRSGSGEPSRLPLASGRSATARLLPARRFTAGGGVDPSSVRIRARRPCRPLMHARKLESGKWRVWIKHAGQTRTVTAATRALAMRDAAEVRLAMADVGQVANGNISVLELLTHH